MGSRLLIFSGVLGLFTHVRLLLAKDPEAPSRRVSLIYKREAIYDALFVTAFSTGLYASRATAAYISPSFDASATQVSYAFLAYWDWISITLSSDFAATSCSKVRVACSKARLE